MKKYVLFFAIVNILFFSCSKTKDNPIPVISKNIGRVIISPEYLLQLKSTEIFIGITYFKDYSDKDEITVTLNNQNGTLVSEIPGAIEGSNLLFKFPAINQIGDYKIKLTIKNDQNSIVKERNLRIVNDFSINTIWNSLDTAYLKSCSSYAQRNNNSNFNLIYKGYLIVDLDLEKEFGFYYENGSLLNLKENRPFISCINGDYSLKFNKEVLNRIVIYNGKPDNDPYFILAKYYAELNARYGNFVSQTINGNGKDTFYKDGIYTIRVTEHSNFATYTYITK